MMMKTFFFLLFPAAASKSSKQSTLQFKPVSKKPKKNPWSDDESDGSSGDSDMEAEEAVAPRERVERKTKGVCVMASDGLMTLPLL